MTRQKRWRLKEILCYFEAIWELQYHQRLKAIRRKYLWTDILTTYVFMFFSIFTTRNDMLFKLFYDFNRVLEIEQILEIRIPASSESPTETRCVRSGRKYWNENKIQKTLFWVKLKTKDLQNILFQMKLKSRSFTKWIKKNIRLNFIKGAIK
jgi:hypothetical protein